MKITYEHLNPGTKDEHFKVRIMQGCGVRSTHVFTLQKEVDAFALGVYAAGAIANSLIQSLPNTIERD